MVILSCILSGIIVLQALLHHFERKDIYNRIMCKDYHEYKGEKHQPVLTAHRKRLTEWRGKGGENE